MSAEKDTPEVEPEEATPAPTKKTNSRILIARDDAEGIKAKADEAISCILPAAKNHPEVYNATVRNIKSANLRQNWTNTPIFKDFMVWCRASPLDSRPNLVNFLTVLAAHDTFEKTGNKFMDEVNARNLKEWANEQLKVPPPAMSATQSTQSQNSQQAPKVKIEQSDKEMGMLQQLVQNHQGTNTYAGMKRPASSHSDEPANKRVIPSIEREFPALQAQPERIILRDTGTQTDEFSSLGDVIASMKRATQTMDERSQVQDEHNKTLQEDMKTLKEDIKTMQELFNRALANQQVRSINNSQQNQLQELIPLQPANRAPPSFYYDPSLGPGSGGPTFRFG
ncbi:hypothetical protein NXS19_004986 [Fusarium pseudograminearum]|uniref:Uncharacterized protein n=1 Tax=Fusarium pseudograminearum (strain CS3096) TaxID=1028729 RepID=K3UF50_FUSPC|nr:hypothetical protein FPSE_09483 [Fusarium pseudograminearum CS3096]EKJ70266.1 hypothetical protein FPSE_09483 [Fusarium pseudograminearum CS3096]KAF0637034.1 hypothetical protein FPSE5266_09483 [Fusarium pseudograminearum]UZP37170.1 hypothetical protein NXS19_004986 [Fusarium pseudograminearum]